jgi:hypothetical protein
MPKSLLFTGGVPFTVPPGCGPCRQEAVITVRKNGRLYTYTLHDQIVVEDPYLMLVKAEAFALKVGEQYNGTAPPRSVRDFLIKSNVVI